jgi:hypothetical protein
MYDGFILAGKIATNAGRQKQPVISADSIKKLSEEKRWVFLFIAPKLDPNSHVCPV